MGLFSSNDIGIDLGTANTLVCVDGKIYSEPSVIAINREDNRAIAFGNKAREYIGRTHDKIYAIRPIRKGFISSYTNTEKMIEYFIRRAIGKSTLRKPRVVACIPSGATEVERKSVWDAIESAGAREIEILEEPICAAKGVDIDIRKPEGNMIIDIGGGTSDVAVISLGGIVCSKSLKIGGDDFDEAIIKFLKERYSLSVGERTAEEVKIQIGSAYETTQESRNIEYENDEEKPIKTENERSMKIKGLLLGAVGGYPKNILVSESEIREALEEPVKQIVETVKSIFEITPPELAADIYSRGIIMTGGGSQLRGLVERLKSETSIDVMLADNPVNAVIRGIQKRINERRREEGR
ncbi:MAG: rod shape-determining protein [Eubacteriales bacterium]|nr:rod shape-determining protein [Eubacteriales bacterium]